MHYQIQPMQSPDGSVQVTVLHMIYLLMKNYNYLVVDEAQRLAVIVDPAWQMEKVENAIAKANVKLEGVLLTHSHSDHVHLAKTVAEHYDCPIWMSRQEICFSQFNAPQLVAIDEREWSFGQTIIKPIFTPGHTPGGVCYLIGNNLFTGDTLFAEGCGMCPSDEAAGVLYESLKKLKNLPPQTRVYPGHSYGKVPGQTMHDVIRNNLYLQFKRQQDFVTYRMRKSQNRKKMFEFF